MYPDTSQGQDESLEHLEAEIRKLRDRSESIKCETREMESSNDDLARENGLLLGTVLAVNEADYNSMRNETGVLERAQNANQRDVNILETQLRKLRKQCQLTDMEFNAVLTAVAHLSAENDKIQALVQLERSMLTPAAMQAAFEMIQKTMFDRISIITPEYVEHQYCNGEASGPETTIAVDLRGNELFASLLLFYLRISPACFLTHSNTFFDSLWLLYALQTAHATQSQGALQPAVRRTAPSVSVTELGSWLESDAISTPEEDRSVLVLGIKSGKRARKALRGLKWLKQRLALGRMSKIPPSNFSTGTVG
jgi:hypothetical protein